jgi:hypothetical protein
MPVTENFKAQVSQPAQAPVSSTPAAGAPPTDPGRAAALQGLRERLVQLSARAGAVRGSLETLQRSQAAGGLGLRRDMSEAAGRMSFQLEGANAAIRAGDASSAARFLDMAEREIGTLETFFGK